MRTVLILARRDLGSLFGSLQGYVVTSMLLLLFGTFFYFHMRESREATMRDMFTVMNFLFLFVVPLLTMGSLADERRGGTLDLLLTSAASRTQIVLGKFLACSTFYTLVVVLTLEFVAVLSLAGTPDPGPVVSGYVGLLLSGYLAIAVGIYTSSRTSSPLVAALSAYGLLLGAWLVTAAVPYLSADHGIWVRRLGIMDHLSSYESGVFSMRDSIYFLTGVAGFLTFTVIAMSQERDNPPA